LSLSFKRGFHMKVYSLHILKDLGKAFQDLCSIHFEEPLRLIAKRSSD
jgi:hypothetical protein